MGTRGSGDPDEPIVVVHVDEDAEFLSTTAAFFDAHYDDIVIESVSDPTDVPERLNAGDVDCVVSDYATPEMDGLELLSAVRAEFPQLPFVLYTGMGTEELASEAVTAGVTEYVRKRASNGHYDLLVERIRNAVSAYRTQQRAAELAHVANVVRRINRALLRADSEAELFEDATETIVDTDPYVGACIATLGEADPFDRLICAGVPDESFDLAAAGERSEVSVLAREALETRTLQVRQHLAPDPIDLGGRPVPGSEYGSVAAIPLVADGDPFGVLIVYAREPFAFDDVERELLEEVAGDVGFAANAIMLRERLEHRATELELLTRVLRHDVRNDIQVVLGWCALLAETATPDQRAYVEKIETTGRHIAELTNSARDVVEPLVLDGDMPIAATAVTPLLEAEVEKAREAYGHADFSLDLSADVPVVLANEMLASVFRNVLNNAVQHHDGEQPQVEVTMTTAGERVVVRIADDGPGIPPDRHEAAFSRGEHRLGSAGTGMGLYLVETLVDLYGGTVRIEDNDPGTVVVIDLPTIRSE
ncbi:MAG: ATP-binding protein [Halapricum sp.]